VCLLFSCPFNWSCVSPFRLTVASAFARTEAEAMGR
jgi:hypothetical protein